MPQLSAVHICTERTPQPSAHPRHPTPPPSALWQWTRGPPAAHCMFVSTPPCKIRTRYICGLPYTEGRMFVSTPPCKIRRRYTCGLPYTEGCMETTSGPQCTLRTRIRVTCGYPKTVPDSPTVESGSSPYGIAGIRTGQTCRSDPLPRTLATAAPYSVLDCPALTSTCRGASRTPGPAAAPAREAPQPAAQSATCRNPYRHTGYTVRSNTHLFEVGRFGLCVSLTGAGRLCGRAGARRRMPRRRAAESA